MHYNYLNAFTQPRVSLLNGYGQRRVAAPRPTPGAAPAAQEALPAAFGSPHEESHLEPQDRPPPLFSSALGGLNSVSPEPGVPPSDSGRFLFAKPDFSAPNGAHEGWRALARSLWGMPGGLGIASAIEPAGGVSPLRGGAEMF